jgi:hypothetical protein
VRGAGTYFASAFERFLRTAAPITDPAKSFIVFPDYGAHRRFYTMVHLCIPGIPFANILWIEKTRVGAQITQSEGFKYVDEAGAEHMRDGKFPTGAFILMCERLPRPRTILPRPPGSQSCSGPGNMALTLAVCLL